ncbi:MAG: fimbrillin family protein [Bacteroidales bacterium]|nr:fimbrillin family protein [Bacteroidales bacterium]
MKSKYILLLLAAAGALSLAGCQKTGLFGTGGGEIRFSATASPAGTKTEYGNVVNGDDDLPIWQSIDWTADDQIRIYSDNAVRRVGYEQGETDLSKLYHWADYSLANIKKGTANDQAGWSSAELVNESNDGTGDYYDQEKVGEAYHVGNGLFWPDNTTTANFYAIYPKPVPAMGGEEDEGVGTVDGANGKLNGYIPDTQGFSEGGNLKYYGYMTAFGSAQKPANDAKTNVALNFYPAFTAFEISIRSAGEPIGLSQFKLVSDNDQKLAGDFYVQYANGAPTYVCTADNNKNEIAVSLANKIAPGATENTPDLTFTVLALPQDFSKLHVEFTKSTGETRKLALKYADTETTPGNYVTFAACRKHRIYGLALPNGEMLISVGTAPWVAGDDYTFSTIENITTGFVSVKRYDTDGDYTTWDIPGTYIGIAKGIEGEVPVDPENPDGDKITTNRPLHSSMFTLHTVSVGVPLELCSDNPDFKFVVPNADGRTFSTPQDKLTIRASENIDDIDDEVTTEYFVVAENATEGATANIRLIRTDLRVPVAYSHSDLPGSNDHTKVPFILLSEADYNAAPTITPSK